MTHLDTECSLCNIKPSDLDLVADTIMCDKCKGLNLVEKNPYISYGKFPYEIKHVKDIEKFDRYLYLREIKGFENPEKNL